MQDVHTELNPGLSWRKQHSAGRILFTPGGRGEFNGSRVVPCGRTDRNEWQS